MKTKKPWLKKDGTPKTKIELEKDCRTWKTSDWNDYLAHIEVNRKEILLDNPKDSESYSESLHKEWIKSLFDQSSFTHLESKLAEEIKKLSVEQQHVLKEIFWNNLSLSEAAEKLRVNKSTVMRNRDRALQSLSKAFISMFLKIDTHDHPFINEITR